MSQDSIQDSTRVVVSQLRYGGILPGNRAEMWRDIFLLPGADLRGSAFGNRMTIEGPNVKVEFSVYVRGELHIKANQENLSNEGNVTFCSCVATPDSILVDQVPFRIRFLSNIYTGVINLRNSIVYGNVYANSGVIRDSVILGGVFCKQDLTLENCMITTFRSKKVNIGKNVSLFFPIALSEQPISIPYALKALSFHKLFNKDNSYEDVIGGSVLLDEKDVYEIDSGSSEDNEEKTQKLYVLSMDQRILDTKKIIKHFRENRRFLEYLTLIDHFSPRIREQIRKDSIAEFEDLLMSLVEQKDIPEVSGYSNIEDIFIRAEVVDAIKEIASDEAAEIMQSFSNVQKNL